jgi:hypothetical protein
MRNVIRLGVLTCLGVVAALGSACAAVASPPRDPGGEVAFTSLLQVAVPGQSGVEIRKVVRDDATWKQVWAELRAGSSLAEAPPAVDFQQDMVIVTAMPTQSCVSKVTIRGIRGVHGGRDSLEVDLLEEPPAANCRCIVSQRPIHAVRLPRSAGAVRFTATVTPHAC